MAYYSVGSGGKGVAGPGTKKNFLGQNVDPNTGFLATGASPGGGGGGVGSGGTITPRGGIPQTPYVPNITPPSSVVSTPKTPTLTTNPFQQSALQSTQAAGNASAGQGAKNINQADLLRMMGSTGAAAAGRVLSTGFDPQNDLYDRTRGQLQDQVRAGESARGIAMSPYGAGVENQAMSNFNIDWQNNLLNRQIQGLEGFSRASDASGAASAQGANIGGTGVGQIAAQGQLPYQQSQTNQQNDISNWLAIVNAGQANYPLTWAQQQATNYGGVPTPNNPNMGGAGGSGVSGYSLTPSQPSFAPLPVTPSYTPPATSSTGVYSSSQSAQQPTEQFYGQNAMASYTDKLNQYRRTGVWPT